MASPLALTRLRGLVVALPLLGLVACQDETATVVKAPAPVVQTVSVRQISLAETRVYSGVVRPRTERSAAFRIGGKVAERLKDVGDKVTAGEVVARLDPTDLDLQVQQAQAAVLAAKSNLARAEAEERRARTLLDKGHAAAADYEGQQLARDEAVARLANAGKALELAVNQRTYADLTAPVDGVVSAVSAEAGQVVGQGTAVLTVAESGRREVLVSVPESRLDELTGASASVELWAGTRSYDAEIREISPEADPASRTYPVRFAILGADDAVRIGMTATVTLTRGDPTPVMRIPSTAVLDDGRGPVVFLIDPGTTRLARRRVEIARFESDDVVVKSGLRGGDRVVAMGVNRLNDGELVRVSATN